MWSEAWRNERPTLRVKMTQKVIPSSWARWSAPARHMQHQNRRTKAIQSHFPSPQMALQPSESTASTRKAQNEAYKRQYHPEDLPSHIVALKSNRASRAYSETMYIHWRGCISDPGPQSARTKVIELIAGERSLRQHDHEYENK